MTVGLLFVMALKNIREGLMQFKRKKFDLNKFKAIAQRHVRACAYFECFSDLYAPSLIVKCIIIATAMCLNGFILLEVSENRFGIFHSI